MSPSSARQDTRRASASSSKPYARNIDNESTAVSQEAVPCVLTVPSHVVHNPGFPTYEQYKYIEAVYLASLHTSKREKALINQAMFDRIWDILLQPRSRDESPQFRFWVRKMFTLGEPRACFPGSGATAMECARPLLLHDGRPVAIQEQIYEIICYCHGRAQHGGRDKTRAVVHEYYSWVPKELVTRFVKACPTCILKKSRKPLVKQQVTNVMPMPTRQEVIPLDIQDIVQSQYNRQAAGGHRSVSENAVGSWPLNGGPLDSTVAGASSNRPTEKTAVESSEARSLSNLESIAGIHFDAPHRLLPLAKLQDLYTHPMSREVSLYKGLPNGWQYHSEYPEAYEACLKEKDQKVDSDERRRAKRPRIPSVVPLRNANLDARCQQNKENAPDSSTDSFVVLPSLKETLSGGAFLNLDVTMKPIEQGTQGSLPPSLQRLRVFLPVSSRGPVDNQPPYFLQIDRAPTEVERLEGSPREESQSLNLSSALGAKLVDVGNLEGGTTANLIQDSSKPPQMIDNSTASPATFHTSHRLSSPFDFSTAPPLASFQSFQHMSDLCPFSLTDSSRPASSTNLGFS